MATIRQRIGSVIMRAFDLPAAPIGTRGGNYSAIGNHAAIPLAFSGAWACVQLLTQDMAKLPLQIWTGSDDEGWQPYKLHPLYSILRRPNGWMSRYELIRHIMLSLLIDGNAYCLIVRDREGTPTQLLPINPVYVTIYTAQDNGELFYQIAGPRIGALEGALARHGPMVPQRDILHVRNLSLDGIVGLSPLTAARYAVDYGISLERQGAGLTTRGGKPGGIITMPTRLSPDAAKRLREEWDQVYNGNGEGIGKTAILEEGTKFEPLSFRAVDAQFLESRRFQLEEVCRFFRVPGFMAGAMEKLSYNNVEHLLKLYTDSTLMPLGELIEGAFTLAFDLRAWQVVEFDYSAMLKADTAGRFNKYSKGIQWGVLNPNDCRREEGLNPYRGGEVYLRPVNMAPADEAPEAREPAPAAAKGDDDDEEETDE